MLPVQNGIYKVYASIYAVTQGANGPLLTVTLFQSSEDAKGVAADINTQLKGMEDDKVQLTEFLAVVK